MNGGAIKQDLDGNSNQDFHPGLEGDPCLPVEMEVKEELNPEVDKNFSEEMDEETDDNQDFTSEMDRDDSGFQLDGSGCDNC